MQQRDLLEQLFEEAVGISPDRRDRYLRENCPSDALRAEVERLLEFHEEDDAFLEVPIQERWRRLFDLPTERLGDFAIIREIGRGGMSTVYLARDTVLDREVALKILGADRALSEDARHRFLHEAKAAAGLSHPHIVKIFRYGESERHCFIAMEHIEGETLDEWVARQDHDTTEGRRKIVRLISEVAEALDHAHRAGVEHRDVKPRNVMVDPSERPVLADFGIARIDDGSEEEDALAGAGTAAYMSPEQIAAIGHEVDHRTDIFSLGVVLYEALTGKRPFNGATSQEVKEAIASSVAPRLRSLTKSLPRDLERVCLKALEKRATDRYPTAGHFAADLRSWIAGEPVLARPAGVVRKTTRFVSRNRVAVGAASMLLAGFGGGKAWQVFSSRERAQVVVELIGGEVPPGIEFEGRFHAIEPAPVDEGEDPVEQFDAARLFSLSSGETWDGNLAPGAYALRLVSNDGAWGAAAYVWLTETDPVDIRIRAYQNGSQPEGMVLIDAGDGAPFLIDQHEVSNRDFAMFLETIEDEQLKAEYRPGWWGEVYSEQWDNLPVTSVTHDAASAYAAWRGARLPTALEWDRAVRGSDDRRFPWGNDERVMCYANAGVPNTLYGRVASPVTEEEAVAEVREDYLQWVQPVDASSPRSAECQGANGGVDRTPDGIWNLYGNVAELTATYPVPDEHLTLDIVLGMRVAKGKSWGMSLERHGIEVLSGSKRENRLLPDAFRRRIDTGFRCARDLNSR